MPTLKFVFLLSVTSIGLTYGFVTSFRRFIRLDTAEDTETALTWHEGPHRSLFLSISSGLVVALRDVTILVMACLLLACASRYGGQEFTLINDIAWQTAALALSAAHVGLIWWIAGSVLVSLVVGLTRRRIRVAVSPSEIRWGVAHLPWASFSHFESESSSLRLRFYSAYSPDLCTISITPPQSVLWEQAVSTAARNLPDAKEINPRKGERLKGWYYVENYGLCTAALLLSIFLFRFSTLWSQFLQLAVVLLFVLAGSAIDRRYLFAGVSPREFESQR